MTTNAVNAQRSRGSASTIDGMRVARRPRKIVENRPSNRIPMSAVAMGAMGSGDGEHLIGLVQLSQRPRSDDMPGRQFAGRAAFAAVPLTDDLGGHAFAQRLATVRFIRIGAEFPRKNL